MEADHGDMTKDINKTKAEEDGASKEDRIQKEINKTEAEEDGASKEDQVHKEIENIQAVAELDQEGADEGLNKKVDKQTAEQKEDGKLLESAAGMAEMEGMFIAITLLAEPASSAGTKTDSPVGVEAETPARSTTPIAVDSPELAKRATTEMTVDANPVPIIVDSPELLLKPTTFEEQVDVDALIPTMLMLFLHVTMR